jgi:hypothetical protein
MTILPYASAPLTFRYSAENLSENIGTIVTQCCHNSERSAVISITKHPRKQTGSLKIFQTAGHSKTFNIDKDDFNEGLQSSGKKLFDSYLM